MRCLSGLGVRMQRVPGSKFDPSASGLRAYRNEIVVSAEMVAGTLPRRSEYPENILLAEPSYQALVSALQSPVDRHTGAPKLMVCRGEP